MPVHSAAAACGDGAAAVTPTPPAPGAGWGTYAMGRRGGSAIVMDIQVGSIVGDYEVTGILGAGGMGKVYKVRNLISHRIEALKVLHRDVGDAGDEADRFLREIRVLARLEHPNIAGFHTAVRVGDQLVLVMEFVDGVTLDRKVKEGPLPVAGAIDCLMQVLQALDYAHCRGVIHRDIKPANMILTMAGVTKLMDFGIAKGAMESRLTMTNMTIGSMHYMSPEQIDGSPDVDARADIYSAGVSLFELVTGNRPFDGESPTAVLAAHLRGTPAAPTALNPSLGVELSDAILMAVARDREERFQTAAAFRNALKHLRDGRKGL